jgi:hypothetical protein
MSTDSDGTVFLYNLGKVQKELKKPQEIKEKIRPVKDKSEFSDILEEELLCRGSFKETLPEVRNSHLLAKEEPYHKI